VPVSQFDLILFRVVGVVHESEIGPVEAVPGFRGLYSGKEVAGCGARYPEGVFGMPGIELAADVFARSKERRERV